MGEEAATSPVYTLVTGAGGTDIAQFSISGNRLKTRTSFNFESRSSDSIRVQMKGSGGVVLTQVLLIQVIDVAEGAVAVVERGAIAGMGASANSGTEASVNYTVVSSSDRQREDAIEGE